MHQWGEFIWYGDVTNIHLLQDLSGHRCRLPLPIMNVVPTSIGYGVHSLPCYLPSKGKDRVKSLRKKNKCRNVLDFRILITVTVLNLDGNLTISPFRRNGKFIKQFYPPYQNDCNMFSPNIMVQLCYHQLTWLQGLLATLPYWPYLSWPRDASWLRKAPSLLQTQVRS